MNSVFHALVLNLHQPSGNLEELLATQEWEAHQILLALDRMPRSLWPYEDVARVHLSLSGTLLETLANPDFQRRVYGTVKCGDLLWHLQNENIFHVLGTAYYHPVLPLIPADDREEQMARWQGIGRHLFWREQFPGFWPPEMGFSMELIPLLRRLGYRCVLVDSEHVEPLDPMLGGNPVSAASRAFWRRRNRGGRAGPRTVQCPRGRYGRRLVHAGSASTGQILQLSTPRDYRQRWR